MQRTYVTLSALAVLGVAAVACSLTDLAKEEPPTAGRPAAEGQGLARLPAPPSPAAEPEADAAEMRANMPARVAQESLALADVAAATGAQPLGVVLPADPPLLPHPMLQPEDRERYQEITANPVRLVGEAPVSTFAIDVDTAAYANVRRFLKEGVLPPVDAVRVEEMINYFDYAYAPPADARQPFATHVALFSSPWDDGKQLLRIGIKGYEIEATERPPANLVFLVDTSGSMDSADKLPLLKHSLRLLVDQMRAEDRIAIVAYAGSAGVVLEPTSGAERATILHALETFQAGGSTAGAEGIHQAYQLAEAHFDQAAVNRVILATDGDFNVGVSDPDRLEDFIAGKRETGVYLSILGFGRGNLNDLLMQKLAQAGNGNASYIDGLLEARKVLVDEMGRTLFPIADDVKIQIEFNPKEVAEYRLIGYETRMLRREDFNNDQIDAGEIGSGHAVTALYEITRAGSPSRLVDDLRYGVKPASLDRSADAPGEVAWLRLRYKRPGEGASALIEQPVQADQAVAFDQAPAEARFASAVAAFGEILRQSAHVGSLDLDAVEALARPAMGEDAFGYRHEFLQLIRLAKTVQAFDPGRG